MRADTTEREADRVFREMISTEVAALVERAAAVFQRGRDSTRAELEHVLEHNLRLEAELQTMRDRIRALESELATIQGAPTPADARAGTSSEAPLQLMSGSADPAMLDERLVEYGAHLFQHIQSIYNADVDAMTDMSLIVERLVANLRHARAAFGRRLEACGGRDWSAFDRQLALLLDSEAQSAFGRHLAIAAYSYLPSVRAEAS
jgi:hypothetical protein